MATQISLSKNIIIKKTSKKLQHFTELEALKLLQSDYVPKLYGHKKNKITYSIYMEYIPGKKLSFYKNKLMSEIWWKNILYQIVCFCKKLEDMKILHNDLWDDNILVYKNKIKVIDYEYSHDYSRKTRVYSAFIVEGNKNEKLRLGWSVKWHTGGDLNQILGILSEYTSIPKKYKQYIRKHVLVRPGSDFPYATTKANIYLNPDVLLNLWFSKS